MANMTFEQAIKVVMNHLDNFPHCTLMIHGVRAFREFEHVKGGICLYGPQGHIGDNKTAMDFLSNPACAETIYKEIP